MSARKFDLFGTAKRFGNVTIVRDERFITVLLHGNEVVVLDRVKNMVKLSNCGWVTPTTHKAINNALNQIKAPFGVYAKQGVMMLYFEADKLNKPLINGQWLKLDTMEVEEAA